MFWTRKKKERDFVIIDKELFDKEFNHLIMECIVRSFEYIFEKDQVKLFNGFDWKDSVKKNILDSFRQSLLDESDTIKCDMFDKYKEMDKGIEKRIGDYIDGEEFIDKIIDRINRKQIKSSSIKE